MKNILKRYVFIFILLTFAMSIPACTTSSQQATTTTSSTATTDPYAVCPTPTEGTSLYINADQGYCLLYPSDFTMAADELRPNDVMTFTGPITPPPPDSMQSLTAYMSFEYNGPAGGLDSRAYAEKWIVLYATVEGYYLEDTSVGGQAGVIFAELPGMIRGQGLFVVANGQRYLLSVFPTPGDYTSVDEIVLRGWNTIAGSLAFFTPQAPINALLPEDICPQETSENKLFVNEADGYCYLYPADFSENTNFAGMFVGGPVLADHPNFGDVRTSINLGTRGYEPGLTPRQIIASFMDQIDQASLTDLTIGGYPAVAFIHVRSPWSDRSAYISVDGNIYTLLAQPYEPAQWPDGIPYLNRAWDTVVNSLQFFDPWR